MSSSIAGAASTASTSSASTSPSSSSRTEIAGNFQQFLQLLTVQLQNQNPLDPLDTNQFTQQLVEFAGVEQQLKTNDTLSSLLTSAQTTSTANVATYVGLNVTADGSSTNLSNGTASWTINPAKAATKATITISDSAGQKVTTLSTSLQAGSQTYTWNGKNAAGVVQPSGTYSIKVAGQDASGQAVTVSTSISGTVSAVDLSTGSPVLTIGSTSVPLSKVQAILPN